MKFGIASLSMAVLALSLSAAPAMAGTTVVEGDEALALYEEKKGVFQTLKQLKKKFYLISPAGEETKKPKKMTVKAGEFIFLTNDEEKIVHNVYDESDKSWVLKKQQPGGTAAISFDTPGVHKLRCAIHPKMRVEVTVE